MTRQNTTIIIIIMIMILIIVIIVIIVIITAIPASLGSNDFLEALPKFGIIGQARRSQ